MTRGVVEAVFFARYTKSNFRALYGRLPTDEAATYSKDFLQVLQEAGAVLEEALSASRTEPTDIVYEWPTGSCPGKFQWAEVRWWMKWLTQQKPLPWTIGDTSRPEISIPGDPSLRRPSLADLEYEAIVSSNTQPWLIAVKLAGETGKLHVRTYFVNPQPRYADRALSSLPVLVQQAISELPPDEGSGALRLPAITNVGTQPAPRAAKLVATIQEALKTDPNVLLVGPPGTGKSVALEDLRTLYESRNSAGTVLFDSSKWGGDAWSVTAESRSDALVFHPSYTYENFVAGLYPKASAGGGMELEVKPGPLLCLSHWVSDSARRALLILDEFNRGQAAAIFGDTLSLLDKDKRCGPGSVGIHIQRPYPSQPMPVPASYARVAGETETISDEVRLPLNVHIVAAMNSTDRSVAPLDAAMRRRFTVIRVGPDYDALAGHLLNGNIDRAQQPLPLTNEISHWNVDDVSTLAIKVLSGLNERIDYCLGEDFLLGHALIWGLAAATAEERLRQLAASVDGKVISTLKMTFVDQDEALAAVLGIAENTQVDGGHPPPEGSIAFWKLAPASLASISPKRLVVRMVGEMNATEQLRALRALATI